jgi:hypothetical protein
MDPALQSLNEDAGMSWSSANGVAPLLQLYSRFHKRKRRTEAERTEATITDSPLAKVSKHSQETQFTSCLSPSEPPAKVENDDEERYSLKQNSATIELNDCFTQRNLQHCFDSHQH